MNLLEDLCRELDISVGDLLAGKKLEPEQYQEETEKMLVANISSGQLYGFQIILYLLTAAFYLQAGELMGVFLFGLLLSGGAALLILAAGFLSGKDRGRDPLPFAVFLFPAVILTLYLKYGSGPG